jgi:hypothetical protein
MVLTMMNRWIDYMIGEPDSPVAQISNELGGLLAHVRKERRAVKDPEDIVLLDKAVDMLSGLKEAFEGRERDRAAK